MRGSECAWVAMVEWSIERNWGFSVKDEGDGGSLEAVPTASRRSGGEFGRRVRRCVVGFSGFGKVY
jgi:hypothetical protein